MLWKQDLHPAHAPLSTYTKVLPRNVRLARRLPCCNSSGDQPEGSPKTSSIPDSIPALQPDTDWREFRARLVGRHRSATDGLPSLTEQQSIGAEAASTSQSNLESQLSQEPLHWAHSIPAPEKGCLLLAHPLIFQERQTYFHQAAILILEHNERGSYGIILNQPSEHTLGELVFSQPLEEFKDCPLYMGGDVGSGEVHVLHSYDLPNSVEIVKGVRLGGIEAAAELVAKGEAKAQDFKWFAKYAGWGPKQLERECKAGAWFPAAASASLILERPKGSNSTLWHMVLQQMGGDYNELSMNVRASEERWKK